MTETVLGCLVLAGLIVAAWGTKKAVGVSGLLTKDKQGRWKLTLTPARKRRKKGK